MMGEMCSNLQAVAEVLREELKLPSNNKKTLLFIILSTSTLYFLLLTANIVSLIPPINDMSGDGIIIFTMDPIISEYNTQEAKIRHVSMVIVLVTVTYLVLLTLVSLVSMVFTIYLSSLSFLGRDLTIKELCLKVKRIWIRPLATWFYISLLCIGLIFLSVCFVLLVSQERGSIIVTTVGIFLLLVASFFDLYISLVWMLSLANSISEYCNGFEALGNTAKLAEGRKVIGVLLGFNLAIHSSGISLSFLVDSKIHQTAAFMLLMAWVVLMLATMVKILSMMVYTVFYFKRKESPGELVDIKDELGYNKVFAVASDLP